jgi:hypothetical protein
MIHPWNKVHSFEIIGIVFSKIWAKSVSSVPFESNMVHTQNRVSADFI